MQTPNHIGPHERIVASRRNTDDFPVHTYLSKVVYIDIHAGILGPPWPSSPSPLRHVNPKRDESHQCLGLQHPPLLYPNLSMHPHKRHEPLVIKICMLCYIQSPFTSITCVTENG